MRCLLCAAKADHRALCAPCRADVTALRLQNPCLTCGAPHNAPHCGACATHPPPLARLIAHREYRPPLNILIMQYKYGKKWQLASTLAEFTPPPPRADLILPIPLHPRRERRRGFNQARELAKKMRLSPTEDILHRIKDTSPQADAGGPGARRQNILGAFAATPLARGKSVLLIDDVMTSGATLNEAATTLLKAGATQVSALVIARAIL